MGLEVEEVVFNGSADASQFSHYAEHLFLDLLGVYLAEVPQRIALALNARLVPYSGQFFETLEIIAVDAVEVSGLLLDMIELSLHKLQNSLQILGVWEVQKHGSCDKSLFCDGFPVLLVHYVRALQ